MMFSSNGKRLMTVDIVQRWLHDNRTVGRNLEASDAASPPPYDFFSAESVHGMKAIVFGNED
jgi:hypothetical protein